MKTLHDSAPLDVKTAYATPETDTRLVAPPVSADQLDLVRRTVAKDATADELKLYLYDCQRQGVHPLDRLVHFTKRSGKYTPITSIDFMRMRAADSGEYAGNDDPTFAEGDGKFPGAATVTVHRLVQGQRCAFTATARWSEYKPEQHDFMWKRMPHTMLGKCAEALALRKGFPKQLSGLYAREEMDQAGPEPADVVATAEQKPPNGYQVWRDDMTAKADEGYDAFAAAVKAAADTPNLKYAMAHDRAYFSALKAKAQQAGAAS